MAPVIDVHTHKLTKDYVSLLERYGGPTYTLKAVTGGPERIFSLGLAPAYGSGDELAATQAAHLKRWEAPIKASGFTAE